MPPGKRKKYGFYLLTQKNIEIVWRWHKQKNAWKTEKISRVLTFVEIWLLRELTFCCASLKSFRRRRTSWACLSSGVLYNEDDPVETKLIADPCTENSWIKTSTISLLKRGHKMMVSKKRKKNTQYIHRSAVIIFDVFDISFQYKS